LGKAVGLRHFSSSKASGKKRGKTIFFWFFFACRKKIGAKIALLNANCSTASSKLVIILNLASLY
jgi:hypothetical protein